MGSDKRWVEEELGRRERAWHSLQRFARSGTEMSQYDLVQEVADVYGRGEGPEVTAQEFSAALMLLAQNRFWLDHAEAAMLAGLRDATGSWAATGQQLGITGDAARSRYRRVDGELSWPTRVPQRQVAVEIVRHHSVTDDPSTPGRQLGENVPSQLDADTGWWPVGEQVRERARYALVAADSPEEPDLFRVRRMYAITGWQSDKGKWRFTVAGNQPLEPDEVTRLYRQGELPVNLGDEVTRKNPRRAYQRRDWR